MKNKCDHCGKSPIDYLFSISKYWCFHCRKHYDFPLKEGQKSIHIKGLVGNEDSNNNTNK